MNYKVFLTQCVTSVNNLGKAAFQKRNNHLAVKIFKESKAKLMK